MKTIMVCIKQRLAGNSSCAGRGSVALANALEAQIASQALPLRVHRFPCLGLCELGPNMKVVGGDMFHHVAEADLPAIIAAAMDENVA
ncbi:(2Fe-2S) ferredoxin domain-containing protein [Chitinimonas sp. BJYL2]|uniref:(2Fe-2S) ferredoxin domain-containing protein n=1 Tax=Chitinimonas sp. BJYL2 TaxID=2976696 RepID=UPI0022B5DDF6|nr:(2Fe-2S) ferredoxin domain-containing protein [Chitinimonas sp. BJYL2]